MAEKLKIVIEVDSKTGIANMKKFGVSGDKSTKSLERQDKAARKLTGSMKGLIGALGGFVAIRSITGWIDDWVEAAGKQQLAMAGMEQAMRSMGRYTPQLHKELIGLAGAFQKITTFGDEATIEGTKFLLTYKDITDSLLPRTIKTMLDLAAFMKTDTTQAANMLGKASMGLGGELRRVGITIDETIAKSGDFAAILREIEKQIGGQAEAYARTGYGGLLQIKGLTVDAKEKFGELALKIADAGVFETLKAKLEGVNDKMGLWIEQNDTLINQKVKEYVDGISGSLKALVDIYNSLPEGIVGATGYGLVGKALFGKGAGQLIFGLKMLEPYFEKLPQWLQEFSVMLGGGLPERFFEKTPEAPFYRGKIPKRPEAEVGGTARHSEVESYQQITNDLLGASALRAEQILEKDMIQAELLAEQQMEQAQAGLDAKSQLEIYMAGQLYHNLEAMRWQHHMTMKRVAKEEQAMQMKRLEIYQSVAGGVANTFLQISQAGGKQSKEAFKLYQGFAMAEAGISAAKAIIMALASPPGPPWSFVLAGITGGMAAVQIGLIAGAKPPSYDRGGISTTPGMYYSGIPEAHVPLQSGAIPVSLNGGWGGGDTFININMDNPVFQDLETQQAVFAQIAEQIAPNAVVRAYDNDHAIRGRIRSRA